MPQNDQALLSVLKEQNLNLNALIAAKAAVGRVKDLDPVRLLQAIPERTAQHQELF